MPNGEGDGRARLPRQAPEALRQFVACTVDRVELDLSEMDWVPRPAGMESVPTPSVSVDDGWTPTSATIKVGYGYLSLELPATIVDGQDVFAVAEVTLAAIERARAGKGPTFIEAKTLRFNEHDIGTPDLAGWEARSEEEHAAMREREPLRIATERVLGESILTQAEIDAIGAEVEAEVAGAEAFADNSEIARPSVEELLDGVFAR